MRTLLALASLTILIGAGCGDDTTAPVADLAVGADMSATPHDMMTLTCAQILSCEQACAQGATSCALACISEGSSAAKTAFGSFLGCLLAACNPDAGNTNGSCTGATDQSASCQACLGGTGASASMVGKPCHTEFVNCASM